MSTPTTPSITQAPTIQAPTFPVALTVEEGKALLQLIDIAVKAGGLNVAEAGVVLAKKVNAAFGAPEAQA